MEPVSGWLNRDLVYECWEYSEMMGQELCEELQSREINTMHSFPTLKIIVGQWICLET